MKLVEIQNSNIRQNYYDVIKELYNIGLSDITITEHFYYDIQHCYQRMLNASECVDYLIELQGEKK